ncbi:MAG TPA: hypothetical protein VJ454_04445 [Steroidobacteraceae bacterium]|jgi:hypothetical protein|nr:hypothetical protein [Steroidobacteraceae bacterium]
MSKTHDPRQPPEALRPGSPCCAPGPPPSPNLGVVMGPAFAQLSADLGRNLGEGRLGILTAVFEAASINT